MLAMVDYEERARALADETVLTEREADVAALREKGLSHAEVAEELGIKRSTASNLNQRVEDRLERARRTLEELGD